MTVATDFDGTWKEALELYLEPFLALCFPQVHAGIDWTRGYTFLDKELQQVTREAELGRRVVDKLVRVWQRDGDETWVLVHIEVQSQEERDFAERMFVYYYRLYDRYRRPIASLAVLGDERPLWRPDHYAVALWECALHFQFPVVKLLDFQARWDELEASDNPFATVVLAHLTALATRGDYQSRRQAKLTLTRRLYERGYERTEILNLFRFIDWLLQLPEELAQQFWYDVQRYEEAQHMTYITSVERIGLQRGREEGREEGLREGQLLAIAFVLDFKFGATGLDLMPEIRQVTGAATLQEIMDRLKTVQTLDEVRRIYATPDLD